MQNVSTIVSIIVIVQVVSINEGNIPFSIYLIVTYNNTEFTWKFYYYFLQSRYPIYHRLCNGWDWKAWNEVQSRTQVQAAEYKMAQGGWTYSISSE